MKINGKTDIGCNRAENQDTFRSGKMESACWGVVCDGMGGGQNGKLASTVAADAIEELLYRELRADEMLPPEDILADAVQLANAEVFARSGGGEEMMGTTVVCALALQGMFYFAHVGDSRAYIYEDGVLRQITHDHSMVQELVDMGTITKAQASHHPERNVITRALGVEEAVEPSFSREKIAPGSTVLLCSDGLTNMVGESQIEKLIDGVDFWDLARELVTAALNAGGDDNITVLLLRPEEADLA